MGPKGRILITLVMFFIAISLAGGIFLLLQVDKTREQTAEDQPDNPDDPNIIDPNDSTNLKQYTFAAITTEDTIQLFNTQGDNVIINLEHLQWTDIKWSKNKSFVSTIGKDDSGIANLFLYDFSNSQWDQITHYEDNPVEQQIWQTDSNIFYTQGTNPERWIHRIKEASRAELFKLIKTQGVIEEISQNFNKILVKTSEPEDESSYSWLGYIADGNEDWDLSEVKINNIAETAESLNIVDIIFSTNSEKVLITALDGTNTIRYYKTLWGSNSVVEITGTELGYTPVCAVNEDVFIGYRIDQDANILEVLNYNIKTENTIPITEFKIPEGMIVNNEKITCYDTNNLLISVISDTNQEDATENEESTISSLPTIYQWYTLDSNRQTIERIVFLDGMIAVDAR